MSNNLIAVATKFFAHWSANQIDEALAMLADDVLYDNVPFPEIIGRENVRKFHSDFGIGTTFRVNWTVINIAAAGNIVLNERMDVFIHDAGGKIMLPVMGSLTIENGIITVWRDYFDPTDFDCQRAALQP
jgi:limonene-1,2-epoxide hydrolase